MELTDQQQQIFNKIGLVVQAQCPTAKLYPYSAFGALANDLNAFAQEKVLPVAQFVIVAGKSDKEKLLELFSLVKSVTVNMMEIENQVALFLTHN